MNKLGWDISSNIKSQKTAHQAPKLPPAGKQKLSGVTSGYGGLMIQLGQIYTPKKSYFQAFVDLTIFCTERGGVIVVYLIFLSKKLRRSINFRGPCRIGLMSRSLTYFQECSEFFKKVQVCFYLQWSGQRASVHTFCGADLHR